jgi:Raf kinase inhibitor-like YbhB/YbcL family protein
MQDRKLMGNRMSLKLLVVIFLLAIVSGCTAGEKKDYSKEVDIIMQNISISSEAFRAGDAIPVEYTCDGRDISPALSWSGIPAGTQSIALIMDDPDAPMGTWVHWVLFNIPPNATGLPEGVPKHETLSDGSVQGMTDFRRVGYGGPCPPPGKPHRYYFRIYALDTKLSLTSKATKADVVKAMEGHILARGELMGKYGR